MEFIRVPQLNANEDEVQVVEVAVSEGQKVKKGDLLCTLESTKATQDLEAPVAGYVRRLAVEPGEQIAVGELICALTKRPDEPVETMQERRPRASSKGEVRTTRRAEALIEEYDVDIDKINHSGIITERDVLQLLGISRDDLRAPTDRPGGPSATIDEGRKDGIVVYGAGGHARVVIDMIREGRRDLHLVGLIDDADDGPQQVQGVPVVGDANRLHELRERGVTMAALGIGAVTHNALRAELFERLVRLGFELPNIVHPDATVESSVRMGQGNQIFAGAVVSSHVRLGDNSIINSNSVVSHDCTIGDHVHVTPGALLAGGVSVGARTVVGMGATVYLGVEIGSDVVVPNGTDVHDDLRDR